MENTEQVKITCQISSSNPQAALGLRIWLDDQVLFENSHVKEEFDFAHDFSDIDGEHEFSIELFGKLPEHTKIDDAGQILEDAVLNIKNITVDSIDISQLFQQLSKYHHDFNGTKEATADTFYGSMGCNGHVRLKFNTPVYIWLLENM
jgi:hypothetical protein